MNGKRFEKSKSDITDYRIYDYEKEDAYFIDCDDESTVDAIVDLLNEQQATINKQDKEIAELDQQCADFLGDKIKALEEFEECTDKLKQKIFDYKFEIKKLKMENDALRYALKYVKHIEVDIDVDGVIEDE